MSVMAIGDGRGAPSLVTWRGVALSLAAAIMLSWPMLIVNVPLVFPDTIFYIKQGHEVIVLLLETFAPGEIATGGDANSTPLRSAPYAAFVYMTTRWPFGLVVPVLLQGAAVLFLLAALVQREFEAPPVAVALALVACATLTSLPWFVSYLMPDILAAAVVLYAAILVRGFDGLSTWPRLVLGAIAAFAVASHYGHIPLAAACTGTAFAILLVQRRLTWGLLIAGTAPIALAVLANAILGLFAYEGASAAPRRLPVLLARSMEDGPARWYLEENCGTERYAVCAIFAGGVPDNVTDVLWSDGGLFKLDPEQIARVRDEEATILWRAFLDYPAQQTWSFAGNAVVQFVSLGTGDFWRAKFGSTERGALRIEFDPKELRPVLDRIGAVHAGSVLAGALAIAWLMRADGLRVGVRERELVGILAVGLLANAAIFGGLSAPADRYQSRIAWIVPVLAAMFFLERLRVRATAVKSSVWP